MSRYIFGLCFKSSENQSTLLSCACAALAADPSPGFPGNLEFPQFSVLNHPHFLKHRALSMGGRGETQPWLQDWWIPSQQGRADSTESILPINTQLSLKKSGVGSYLLQGKVVLWRSNSNWFRDQFCLWLPLQVPAAPAKLEVFLKMGVKTNSKWKNTQFEYVALNSLFLIREWPKRHGTENLRHKGPCLVWNYVICFSVQKWVTCLRPVNRLLRFKFK